MRYPQLDNASLRQKSMLRQTALRLLGDETPVILETHGGHGDIWSILYSRVENGVVFETDPDKAVELAVQRPTWSVYEADCEPALRHGAGSHLVFNYVDVDPYGSCWQTLRAYFGSQRSFPARTVLVVNDGLRMKAGIGAAWESGILEPFAARYGNHAVWRLYPTVIVRELLDEAIAPAGYGVTLLESYTTGRGEKLVHFLAVLERDAARTSSPAKPPAQTPGDETGTAGRATPRRPTPDAATS